MRILLDESLPRDLATLLTGHEVATVRKVGWSGLDNGKLLAAAAGRFDVFITADQNIEHQQNLAALPIAVVVLMVKRSRVQSIAPVVPELLKLLNHMPPKTLRKVGI